MKKRCLGAVVLVCVFVSGSGLVAREAPPSLAEEIPRLIKLLGDDQWRKRKAATDRLIEIGIAALPAVRKAIGDADLEVSMRAMHICRQWKVADAKDAAERQLLVQSAFLRGDYGEMAQRGEALVDKHNSALDLLWLGHAYQLGGNWPKAARTYRKLAEKLGEELGNLAKDPPPRDPADDAPALSPRERAALSAGLARRRAGLMWLVARLQHHELKDTKAALNTLTKAESQIAKSPALSTLGGFYLIVLRQLAEYQESAGLHADAIATWGRIHQHARRSRDWPAVHENGFDVAAVIRLVAALGPGEPLPATPGLIILSPKRPTVKLQLGDDKTRLLAYAPPGHRSNPTWSKFAFSPPPGMEFTSIKFDADLEQRLTTGPAAHIYCKALPRDGKGPEFIFSGVSWPDRKKTGRNTVTRTFNVPAGAGAILISTASMKGHATHGITVEAKLGPQRRPGRAFALKPVLRTELLPDGGTLTCDGRKISANPNVIHNRLGIGRHVLTYRRPDKAKALSCAINMTDSATYGLFLNYDSPFGARHTNLRGVGNTSWWMACTAGLAQLPDGRWLLAGSGRDEKIRLFESKDLLDWSPARSFSLNSVFRNHAARLFVDEKGVIWLAWFSDRLQVDTASWHSRYRLWLAHSRDGRKWSPPRPIAMNASGSDWPPDPVSILQGSKGEVWMYWRHLAAKAESLGGISELKAINMPGSSPRMRNTHVAVDPAGSRHMLFDRQLTIAYSRSDDGRTWTQPVTLIPKPRGGRAWRGQIVFDKSRACVIYEDSRGAQLCRLTMGLKPGLGVTVKIAGRHTPLNAMRLCRTRDGRAVLLAGAESVFLLEARTRELVGARGDAEPE